MEKPRGDNLPREEWEAKENLAGFFKLLLEVDMRNNPQNYENNGNSDNPDKSQ